MYVADRPMIMINAGFAIQPASAAACLVTADELHLTPQLVCLFAHQKPFVKQAW